MTLMLIHYYKHHVMCLAVIIYAQCRGGIGVCPDSTSSIGGTCKEDNFDVSGSVSNGVTCVTYSRYLDTGK